MSSPGRPDRPLTEAERDLARAIEFELQESRATWLGTAIETTMNRFTPASTVERDRVQVEGVGHGCHECGSVLATDPDQPWIGDHIPPWNLNDRVRTAYGLPGHDDTWLAPSCQACSSEQSALVLRLHFSAILPPAASLTTAEQRMLGIIRTWTPDTATRATAEAVLPAQGVAIQAFGIAHGCHICPARVPHLRYIADHNPPTAFNTPGMQRLCDHLNVDLSRHVMLKPHCPRCSSGQGARVRGVMAAADRLMKELRWTGTRHPIPARFREDRDLDEERMGRSLRAANRRRDASPPARDGGDDGARDRGRSRSPGYDRERDRSPLPQRRK
jgi:hypothetical protein